MDRDFLVVLLTLLLDLLSFLSSLLILLGVTLTTLPFLVFRVPVFLASVIFSMSLSLFLISLVALLSALDYRVLSSAILAFLTHLLTLFSEHLQGVATPLLITVILSAPFLHFLTLSMYVLLLSLSLEILSCLLSPLSFLTSILTVFLSALELLRVSILTLTAAIY